MTHRTLTALLFSSVCLIWGTTWLAMEIAVESIPPIFATGLRFLIAAQYWSCWPNAKQPLFSLKGSSTGCWWSRFLLCDSVYLDDLW